jgi:hypothetical protein
MIIFDVNSENNKKKLLFDFLNKFILPKGQKNWSDFGISWPK